MNQRVDELMTGREHLNFTLLRRTMGRTTRYVGCVPRTTNFIEACLGREKNLTLLREATEISNAKNNNEKERFELGFSRMVSYR